MTFQRSKGRGAQHPVIFDAEGNGKWTLISGSGSGRLYAFGIKDIRQGLPVWVRLDGVFDGIRVDGFSTPSIVRDDKAVYMFVGQRTEGYGCSGRGPAGEFRFVKIY
jgi:hypothetical protein